MAELHFPAYQMGLSPLNHCLPAVLKSCCTNTRTSFHIFTHRSHTDKNMHTYRQTDKQIDTHTTIYRYAWINMYIYICIHAHTHTHTHTQTTSLSLHFRASQTPHSVYSFVCSHSVFLNIFKNIVCNKYYVVKRRD